MYLQPSTATPVASCFAVCDPEGRPLAATYGDSQKQSCDLFSHRFALSWQEAQLRGYEVFEMGGKPPLAQPLH